MGSFLAIIQVINAAEPLLVKLVGLLIQKPDGTYDAVAVLDQAEAQNATNIKQVSDWLAAHPAAPKP
jgi:hypothetical protein